MRLLAPTSLAQTHAVPSTSTGNQPLSWKVKPFAESHNTYLPLELPPHVIKFHRNVDLCVDFVHVNGILYLHTIARKLQFRTISLSTNKVKSTITKLLSNVISLYTACGFKVVTIFGDNAFACVRSELHPIVVNITAAREYSPELERSLWKMQGRFRCVATGLPF